MLLSLFSPGSPENLEPKVLAIRFSDHTQGRAPSRVQASAKLGDIIIHPIFLEKVQAISPDHGT